MLVAGYDVPEYESKRMDSVQGVVWNTASAMVEIWYKGALYGYTMLNAERLQGWMDWAMTDWEDYCINSTPLTPGARYGLCYPMM